MRSPGSCPVVCWLVVAAMVTTVTLTIVAGTAHACSCIERGLSEYADDISVAFVGTQLDRAVHEYVDDNGAALLFSVDRVYAGEVGPLIEVRTHAQDSACGIDVGGWGPVGIAARHWRGALSVNLCGSIVTQAELESVFGAGRPPDESAHLPVSPDTAEDSMNTGAPQDDNGEPATGSTDGDQTLLAIVLVAGVAGAVAGAVIVWRRRRGS